MNVRAGASGKVALDRERSIINMPNLVKACAFAGSFVGIFPSLPVYNKNDMSLLAMNGLSGAAAGLLFGYTLHYSYLTVVDGVRMISDGTLPGETQSPSAR